MTIPCSIFRLRSIYWCISVSIIFFSIAAAVRTELMFDSDFALIPAMWLGSMMLVLGIRDWSFSHTWMAGWMFAGAWLILQVAHQAWLL